MEIAQQLQRVDVLHEQLKAETVRAQEFLLKLRRGELEAQIQAQSKPQAKAQTQNPVPRHQQHEHEQPSAETHDTATTSNHSHCKCSCQHQRSLSPSSEAMSRRSNGASSAQHSFHGQVDEREVRDLEKRVRGLEGRVRGFEGFPPDRELALLEVERLRRELESLARRREGLFEGLSSGLMENAGVKKGNKISNGGGGGGKAQGNTRTGLNGKAAAAGKRGS